MLIYTQVDSDLIPIIFQINTPPNGEDLKTLKLKVSTTVFPTAQ